MAGSRYKKYVEEQCKTSDESCKRVGGIKHNNKLNSGQLKIKATGNSKKLKYIKRGTTAPGLDKRK